MTERFLSLPPLALPYSPEFERTLDPDAGKRLEAEQAKLAEIQARLAGRARS